MRKNLLILSAIILISLNFTACKSNLENEIKSTWNFKSAEYTNLDEMVKITYKLQKKDLDSKILNLEQQIKNSTSEVDINKLQDSLKQIKSSISKNSIKKSLANSLTEVFKNMSYTFSEDGVLTAQIAETEIKGNWGLVNDKKFFIVLQGDTLNCQIIEINDKKLEYTSEIIDEDLNIKIKWLFEKITPSN